MLHPRIAQVNIRDVTGALQRDGARAGRSPPSAAWLRQVTAMLWGAGLSRQRGTGRDAHPAGVSDPSEEVHRMAKMTEKKRDSLKASQFGLPEERKYPMPDESHARNAKARAAQQVKKGNLTKAEERKIDRKADTVLSKD
jgi:hypothetical protein